MDDYDVFGENYVPYMIVRCNTCAQEYSDEEVDSSCAVDDCEGVIKGITKEEWETGITKED